MMMHGLTNFKFTLDEFVRAVVLKIMKPVCDARAIFVGFMVKKVKLEYIYSRFHRIYFCLSTSASSVSS
jgi:hypothetical protein